MRAHYTETSAGLLSGHIRDYDEPNSRARRGETNKGRAERIIFVEQITHGQQVDYCASNTRCNGAGRKDAAHLLVDVVLGRTARRDNEKEGKE